ncbi:MAG: hypothetical protein QW524_01640 [Candidatus Woesearchaeota archaeon]
MTTNRKKITSEKVLKFLVLLIFLMILIIYGVFLFSKVRSKIDDSRAGRVHEMFASSGEQQQIIEAIEKIDLDNMELEEIIKLIETELSSFSFYNNEKIDTCFRKLIDRNLVQGPYCRSENWDVITKYDITGDCIKPTSKEIFFCDKR